MSGLELLLEAAAGRGDAVRASVSYGNANCGSASSSSSASVASSEASVHREALLASFLKAAAARNNNRAAAPLLPPATEAPPSVRQPALTRRLTSCSSLPPKKRLRLVSADGFASRDFGLQRRDSVAASTSGLRRPQRSSAASAASPSLAKSSRDSLADLRSNFLGSFAKIPSSAFASSPTLISDITEGSGSGTKNAEFGTLAAKDFGSKSWSKLGPFTVVVPAKGKKGSKAVKKRRGGKANKAAAKRSGSPLSRQAPSVPIPRCPRSKKAAMKDTDGNDIGMGYFSMLSRGASPPVASSVTSTASVTETSEADSATNSTVNSTFEERNLQEEEHKDLRIQKAQLHKTPTAVKAEIRPAEASRAPSAAKAKAELYEAYLRALG